MELKSWNKSIKLDIYYVNNISFTLDLKILLKTLPLILFKKKLYKDFKKSI
jgi:undecaprenyl phosphate N,N'-diacetylbacillosamine 1-phosphate transferase